ncbi:MAG TPA: hypothetical protein PKZ84_11645 [Anaerolineae bacterium]|nr:hypothetical protein [Anaerolineae bacterium]
MILTGPQIINVLREKLQFAAGRHLYGVLGSYANLARFEEEDLAHARLADGARFPVPHNLNKVLLDNIGDDDLKRLGQDEARRPQAVQSRLNQELDRVLGALLHEQHFIILKQIEMLFAFSLDLGVFRIRASNQNHILLLLPGERRGDQVLLFHEAEARFQRLLISNLIADNHLWELGEREGEKGKR